MHGGLFGALGIGPYRRLLLAHGAATLGQFAVVAAVGIAVLERTGSGAWLSVTSALGMVPYVLCSAPAGALADRFPRARVLAVSATLRAALAGLLALGIAVEAPLALLVPLTAVLATLGTVGYPALTAATADLVPDERRPAANALATGIENLTWVAGPGLLGFALLVGAPLGGAALGGAALLALAAGTAARVRTPRPSAGDDRVEVLAGVRLVLRSPAVRTPIAAAALDGVLYGYVGVALVLLAQDELGSGPSALGWLNGGMTVGAAVALGVVPRLLRRAAAPTVLVGSLLLTGTAVALLALSPSVAPAALLLGVVGLTGATTEVAAVTAVQRATPSAVTGRVFGVYDAAIVSGITFGAAAAGPLAEVAGVRPALLLAGLALAVLVAVTALRHRGRAARRPRTAAAPATHAAAPVVSPPTGRGTGPGWNAAATSTGLASMTS